MSMVPLSFAWIKSENHQCYIHLWCRFCPINSVCSGCDVSCDTDVLYLANPAALINLESASTEPSYNLEMRWWEIPNIYSTSLKLWSDTQSGGVKIFLNGPDQCQKCQVYCWFENGRKAFTPCSRSLRSGLGSWSFRMPSSDLASENILFILEYS